MKHKFDYLLCFNENISDQFESGDRGSLEPETINMIKGETYANTYSIRRSIRRSIRDIPTLEREGHDALIERLTVTLVRVRIPLIQYLGLFDKYPCFFVSMCRLWRHR